MKVYKLQNNHSKCMVLMTSDDDEGHPISSRFDGESKIKHWTPFKLKTIYKKTYRDFPILISGKPVISERVKQVIAPFIENEVEFLPLLHDELELSMVNVINVLECVDWKRSDIRNYEDGSFAGFNKLVFDFNKIPDNTYIFKYKERAGTEVYVTELFKELIERNKLKGLDLTEVYDSEDTEEKEQEQQRTYEAALASIERNKGPEISYEEARDQVNLGKAFASDKWKMQLDLQGRFILGQLTLDLTIQWMLPTYIPPILLGCLWHEVE
ncbi:imm11 family protein [Paenibacillus sp. FA6]|uniref:imm11 family protein n=1 Tax=Paenibacillus sp. FA6 TaxID=3413029 RepID=UPI003F6550EC